MFQASDTKGKQFLDLLDDNLQPLESLYSKGGSWLKYFGYSIYCVLELQELLLITLL